MMIGWGEAAPPPSHSLLRTCLSLCIAARLFLLSEARCFDARPVVAMASRPPITRSTTSPVPTKPV